MTFNINKITPLCLCAGLTLTGAAHAAPTSHQQEDTPKKPNIFFYVTEDLSAQYLQMYRQDGQGAEMPNLSRLAKDGLIYENCYSAAPVSSAARTTLITGCYAPRFAGSFHRKFSPLAMPEGLKMFPTYLRRAGYFTANAAKTDYNVEYDGEAWDIMKGKLGDWQKRTDKSQPFFYQRNNLITHESKLQFKEKAYKNKKTKHAPSKIEVHPYLQDSPLMRYTYATFYDRIKDCDNEIGQVIDMLEKEGVLDNTFIFFVGDNGGSLPGTKGYTNDIGFHVPLVVYVPSLWRDKINVELGTRVKDFVSFMDLGPEALALAGLEVPKQMDGQPFIGPNITCSRTENYGYGDRFDEMYAFNRTLRQGKYRYARNYIPYHTQSLYALYRYKQLAFKEWKQWMLEEKLNDRQSRFFEAMGPEELYDVENDPMENHNLALDPKYKSVLKKMRKQLASYITDKHDLGFYPETVIYEEAMKNPDSWGEAHKKDIAKYEKLASCQMKSWKKAKSMLSKALKDKDPVARWWALTSIASFGEKASCLKEDVSKQLDATRAYVRARAIVALAHMGEKPKNDAVYPLLKDSRTIPEEEVILNDFVYLLEQDYIKPFTLDKSHIPHAYKMVNWRMQYINSQK